MAQVTPAQFRADFPAFTDPAIYPDAQITFWLGLAYLRLPARVWGTLLDVGAELYSAHNLAIEAYNQAAANNGAPPGQQVGPLNSKSVSKVSAGYDTGAGSIEAGGDYNLTNYGTRFLALVDIVGSLGIAQIGTGPGFDLAGLVIGG